MSLTCSSQCRLAEPDKHVLRSTELVIMGSGQLLAFCGFISLFFCEFLLV